MTTTVNRRPPGDVGEPSVGDLVKQAAEQLSDLVRGEMRLAQAELTRKGRQAGIGGGLFGGAGVVAHAGFLTLVAAGVAALALVLPVWASALIVAGALFLAAGVMAALGRKRTREAAPLMPEEAISGVRTDVERIKERARR
ncbi:phage holin family protein [Streptomyces zingiberis]|uniref:Phage holin family protein n=1 Tax=Streptomyces zingiberis TaxID=2053010 RepID=A0ABX1C3Y5_9ACTN|nr:phage holin family protein [Streptomyces zingiberis]NJQ02860.1 phage holin family protein [Streptomyces zingiberis]